MENYIIYCHVSPSGKRYIGQTKHGNNPNKRWNNGNGYKDNSYFYHSINKYGWDNFEHLILEEGLTLEQANEREIYWVNYYDTTNQNNGYNLRGGGHNGMLSKETKQKISDSKKGKYTGELNGFYGKHHNDATIQKLKNRIVTDDWKQNMSDNHADVKGKNNPNFNCHNEVLCIETNTIFRNCREAAQWLVTLDNTKSNDVLGVSRNIAGVASGKSICKKTCRGYHWKYVDKEVA